MRRLLLAAVLAFALTLPACSSRPQDPPDQSGRTNPLFEVRQMLRVRGAALAKGNLKAYLANVGPEAVSSEEAIVRGGASVPLTNVGFIFNPPSGTSFDSQTFNDVETELRYSYIGLSEENVFSLGLIYSIAKIRGVWSITKSQLDPNRQDLPDWVRGPLMFKSTKNFLAMYRPGLPKLNESLKAAEDARNNLAKKLGLPIDERQVIFLAKDHAEFASMAGTAETDLDGVLAVANFRSTGEGVAVGRQITADIAALFPDPTSLAREHGEEIPATQVFQHELGHLALSRYAAEILPDWVSEGAAMYLSGERRIAAWKILQQQGLLDVDLSSSIEGKLVGDAIAQSPFLYPVANAAVNYLVEAFGAPRFWEFYRAYRRVPVESDSAGKAEMEATGRLLRSVYGIDMRKLDQSTRDWIRKQLSMAEQL